MERKHFAGDLHAQGKHPKGMEGTVIVAPQPCSLSLPLRFLVKHTVFCEAGLQGLSQSS